ncbi:DUF1750-domain-containing protein [Lojkania enalia]|uniref:DUF1750-domain-containing protein n=1 Tax=Lojkania enalia TaxID=147567 RepID=A0A9P4MZF2_9PLEO|nr:DUF1750-domain-containing protein [Didymosphaeria enalia]
MNRSFNVQDPSGLVPDSVLPHVHLVSTYRFPTLPSLQPAHALEHLIKGPTIVKDTSSVAWTYFAIPPPDGTVLLTWQPPRLGNQFASDGLVWADAEMDYHMEIRGYSLQILMHRAGFIYGKEPVTTHARYRYRIVRGPGHFDPSLWVVHYTRADQTNQIPANQIPIHPDVQMILRSRASIEQAGQLLRKEFMLRDQSNWPTVEFGQQLAVQHRIPPYYNPMQPYMPMQPGPAGRAGPPPAKRPRQQPPPGRGGPVPNAIPGDPTIEEEENLTQDSFDFLTPRDLSLSRYKQHHEWMEEIFSSPYTIGKILPIDLGFGLMGELAPLTAGILEAPAGEHPPLLGETQKGDYSIKNYYKLDPEQLKEFEKRVHEYTSKEEAEIEKMRAEHANKMAGLKKSRTYVKAERRLQNIESNGKFNDANEQEDQAAAVVHDLEKTLGVTFDTKKLVVCVDKGGFIEEQQPPPPQQSQQVNGNGKALSNAGSGDGGSNGLIDESALDIENSAASLLDQYGSNSLTGTPGANMSIPQMSQPQSQSQSAVATPNAQLNHTAQGALDMEQTNFDVQSGATELLDLDVEMSGMTNAEEKGEGDWVLVDQTTNEQQGGATQQTTSAAENTVNLGDQGNMPTSGADTEATAGMFDATDFGSFDNLDTAGDALADYTNADDNMGLDLVDDSAFGDAFHGTEMHHGEAVGENA